MYKNKEGYSDPTAGKALANILKEEKKKNKAPIDPKTIVAKWPKIYVVSKYAGDVKENVRQARRFCRFVASKHFIPIASHLMYPQFLNDKNPKERELGLMFGLTLMNICSEVWCFGTDISVGMKQELEEAVRRQKRVRFFTTEMEEIR